MWNLCEVEAIIIVGYTLFTSDCFPILKKKRRIIIIFICGSCWEKSVCLYSRNLRGNIDSFF